jgi:hypothetical protein
MIKNSSKQTGSVFIVIIIVLVVAIAAGLGFILWNNLQKKAAPEKAANTTKNVAKDSDEPVTTLQSLALNDWYVKFAVPAKLNLDDVYYYKTHIAEGPEYYGFTTDRVRAQGGMCDNQVTGNLTTLTRLTAKNGSGTLINDTAIGGYFYYIGSSIGDITPTPACLLTDAAVQDRALLDELVKTVAAQ